MVKQKVYKGIEFVRVSELPEAERDLFKSTINRDLIIKILMDETVLRDCIQYKDYASWYENVFKGQLKSALKEPVKRAAKEEKTPIAA